MSIDFHRLIKAIDNNRLISIDYIDYINYLLMIDFHRLGTLENNAFSPKVVAATLCCQLEL